MNDRSDDPSHHERTFLPRSYISLREKEEGENYDVFVYLLFEVAPLLLVHQHQVEIVAHRELLVDVTHRGRQLVPTQKQADWDRFPCNE